MLTKKHFEAIAEILHNCKWQADSTINNCCHQIFISEQVINKLADYFATENPNFDKTRFLKAIKGD